MISDFTSKIIGIIGGKGGMGRWFESFFREQGFVVRVSDLDTALSNEELVTISDVVLLATPISATAKLARELGPFLSGEKLLADLASLKEETMRAMLEASPAAVLGLHPLFGPYTPGITGQNMILVPGRGEGWLSAFQGLFEGKGGAVHVMGAEEHDRHMAFVQGIMHFFSIVLGAYMQKNGPDVETAWRISTPTSRVNVDFVGRLFACDLKLYEDLVLKNSHTEKALEDLLAVFEENLALFFHGAEEERKKKLQSIRRFLGTFPARALTESNRILDALSSERKEVLP